MKICTSTSQGECTSDILQQRQRSACLRFDLPFAEPLPIEAMDWDDRECSLWFLTGGAVSPHSEIGASRAGGSYQKGRRVSVVTPTTESRHEFLESLWKSFDAQDWPDKELVVVETYLHEYSTFLEELSREDERIIYVRFKVSPLQDWSIGVKRNIGTLLASGAFIANFDDDDLYAPTYLTTMIRELEMKHAEAVTLSSWYIFDKPRRTWSYCDAIAWGLAQGMNENDPVVKSWAYGYGFSYVYRHRAAEEVPYGNKTLGEDFEFITNLQRQRSLHSVQLVHDGCGICVHVQHGCNTSNTFPIRDVPLEEVAHLDFAEVAVLLDDRLLNLSHGCKRTIEAHMLDDSCKVTCNVGLTVADFLKLVELEIGSSCSDLVLHLVPPSTMASQEKREEVAARFLGIEEFSLELALNDLAWSEESVMSTRRRMILERAKGAMQLHDRIPISVTVVWLAVGDDHAEYLGDVVEDTQPDQDIHTRLFYARRYVDIQIQVLEDHHPSADHCFHVYLHEGSTIQILKECLGGDLPPHAYFMDSSDKGGAKLNDFEVVPANVVVTEFKGKRSAYFEVTAFDVSNCLRRTKTFLLQSSTQQLLDDMERCAEGDEKIYRAALMQFQTTELYPRTFGSGLTGISAAHTSFTARAKGNIQLLERWFEVEVLLRNKLTSRGLLQSLLAKCRSEKLPKPELPIKVQAWLDGDAPSICKGWIST